jgi:Ni/Fe-hydrogenase subunit HybB-like protein
MSAHAHPTPVGGKLLTPGYLLLVAIALVGVVLALYRFAVGLGPVTALSDGYPWGIWIAFDVVTGTAMGAGGYALAILIYVLNKGRYHPLIRGALVTTALGYTIAGISVLLDVGRWWQIWKIPIFVTQWNGNSALLEVAICIMAYMIVAWIEVSGSIFEHLGKQGNATAQKIHVGLRKVLPFVIAMGVLLPTMHQSSLGTLMMLTARLHPLWHSELMPLLFLVSCIAMGYGGVILESAVSHTAFRREIEWPLLSKLSKVVAYVVLGYVVLRVGDVVVRGAFAGASSGFIALFLFEQLLFVVPAVIMLTEQRRNPGVLFASAFALVFAGALYRFDTYLVAYNAGANWSYFPSVTELLITFGLVAAEVAVYVFIVKRFPILVGRRPEPA